MPKITDRIDEVYGRKTPTAFASRHGVEAMPSPGTLVGIELEIENWEWDRQHPGFRFIEDGSLRNNGTEAVSEPVLMMHVPGLLRSFFARFPVTEANYSERCSVHVHVNVLDMTFEQVAGMALTYQALERLLFGFVGNDRDKNIFCVPWSQAGTTYQMLYQMSADPHGMCRRWQKYTALNLLPIVNQGTVEFRHLHGTQDITTIVNWLRLIGRLRDYAASRSITEITETFMTMNTVSNYGQWLDAVFQEDAAILRQQVDFEKKLSLGVVDTKFMLIQPEKKKTASTTKVSWGMFNDDNVWPQREAVQQALQDALVAEPVLARQRARPDLFRRGAGSRRSDYWGVVGGEPRLNPGEQVVVARNNVPIEDVIAFQRNPVRHQRMRSVEGQWILEEIRLVNPVAAFVGAEIEEEEF